jgi:hypothetical protein
LFVSRRQLAPRKSLPRATCDWALDSGGFSELSLYGEWRTDLATFIRQVRRCRDEIGRLQWAAPMDWMCEPVMLARTGLTVSEHQERTTRNYLELRQRAPDLSIIPVLQGWHPDDYLRHAEQYARAGVDLAALPVVGLGTVCRRQHQEEAERIVRSLSGLSLHGFGFKMTGLARVSDALVSADSLAWSYNARRNPPMPGCRHKNCANCPHWALAWRRRLVAHVALARSKPRQLVLF